MAGGGAAGRQSESKPELSEEKKKALEDNIKRWQAQFEGAPPTKRSERKVSNNCTTAKRSHWPGCLRSSQPTSYPRRSRACTARSYPEAGS